MRKILVAMVVIAVVSVLALAADADTKREAKDKGEYKACMYYEYEVVGKRYTDAQAICNDDNYER